MEYADRLQCLVNASKQTGTAAVKEAEEAIFEAAAQLAPKDQPHQQALLDLLKAVDARFPAFQDHPTMKSAHDQLRAASPEVFWAKGLPKVRELRAKLWATVKTD